MDLYEIVPGLFMSGALTPSKNYLQHGITTVVNLDSDTDTWIPHETGWGIYVWWPILDAAMPDGATVRTLAHFIRQLLEEDRKVLVHCNAGFNRSGLVVARTLIAMGQAPSVAIAIVRQHRGPEALSNREFVDWLEKETPGT